LTASSESLRILAKQHQDWQAALESIRVDLDSGQSAPVEVGANAEDAAEDGKAETAVEPSTAPPATLKPEGDASEARLTGSASFRSRLSSWLPKKQTAPPHKTTKLRSLVQEELSPTEERPPAGPSQKARAIVESTWFEYCVGAVIFANLITIGIEAQVSLEMGQEFEVGSWAWIVERVFLIFYCFEAGLRLAAFGRNILLDVWFLSDLALVVIGILALFIMPALAGQSDPVAVEKLLIVRGLRLLRLVRALRMFDHFKIMWRLVYGLLTAGQTIVSTTTLMMVSLFVFGCIAVELIAKDTYLLDYEPTRAIVQKNFFGIDRSVMTLVQFMTLDSVAGVYFPLIERRPYLAMFFLPLLVIISIGLMNLVTAAVLQNAMEHAAEEHEEEKQDMRVKVKDAIPSLMDLFQALDKDGNGTITHKELETVDIDVLPSKFLQAVHAENMVELFDLLDVEESGELTQTAFIEGVLSLCMLDMPVSAVQSLKLLRMILDASKRIELNLQRMTMV
ncbi:Catsper1, partial [Symbiodinium pilosum]